MVKTFKKTLAGLALACSAGIAAAAPISDTYNFNQDFTLTAGTAMDSTTYTHDFTDNNPAYDPLVDMMTSAVLTIYLKDNGASQGGSETFTFLIGSDGVTQLYNGSNVPNGIHDYATTLVAALASLSDTGLLNVTITAVAGSFVIDKSIVDANFETRDAGSNDLELPEPLSLGLFAIGLAGFAASRRRRQQK